jgi:putative tryptophan/tyrosine transport system substrate-binding protein
MTLRRREFITLLGGAAAWPLAAQAQQRAAVPVVGYLGVRSAVGDAAYVEAFRKGLAENSFIPSQNVAIEFRWADGRLNQLPTFATELVRRRVNVLVTAGGAAAPVAKAATSIIPIVFSTGTDPVKAGLVESLNRPGGNLTGVTNLSRELGAKRLGLLRELVPGDPTLGAKSSDLPVQGPVKVPTRGQHEDRQGARSRGATDAARHRRRGH